MSADTELRERFAALRREDVGRTPPFQRVLRHPRRSPAIDTRRRALLACLAIAAIAIPLFLGSRYRDLTAPARAAPWLADWRAPTDFLLDTPGRELLRTVPEIGEPSREVLRLFPGSDTTTPIHHIGQEPHS